MLINEIPFFEEGIINLHIANTLYDKKHMSEKIIEALFNAGTHFGYSKSRRHPSVAKHIYGNKNKVDIINIEHTALLLDKAESFMKEMGAKGKTVLFVGVKPEAKEVVKNGAESAGQPYITERWVGGVMTNFAEINKRIQKLIDLKKKKEEGALEKYTKKEKMLIDEEIARMHKLFSGIVDMKKLPDALFVVDPKKEYIAVTEAEKMNIPVVALANTDCNISNILYPIVANDASLSSITYITEMMVEAYKSGFKSNIK